MNTTHQPNQQLMEKMKMKIPSPPSFNKGCRVEVSSDEEGFKGAWFVADVVSVNQHHRKKNQKILVRYKTLVEDENGLKLLREFVDVPFIRPLPPPDDGNYLFQLYDIVDAYHRDGWWRGFIAAVRGDGGCRYLVSFENPTEAIEFDRSELRLHLDWVNCKWVQPPKQILPQLALATSDDMNAGEAQPPVMPCPSMKTVLKKSKKSNTNDAFISENPTVGDLLSAMKSKKRSKLENKEHAQKRKGSAEENRHSKRLHLLTETKVLQAKNSHQLPGKASSNAETSKDLCAMEEQEEIITEINEPKGGKSQQKKARRRPRKLPVERPKGAVHEMDVIDCDTNVTELPIQARMGVSDSQEAPSVESSHVFQVDHGTEVDHIVIDDMPSDIFDEQPLLMRPQEVHSPTVVKNSGVSHSRPLDEETDGQFAVLAPAVVENGDSVGKCQKLPFVKCSLTIVMNSGVSHSRPSGEASGGQLAILPPTVVEIGDSVGKCKLPFVKCSPVWNSIESLEVFQKTPQKPHFAPLVECKEVFREGLAIGHMVTFANVVERISKLQFADPRTVMERSLGTLIDLENHGFDVEVVRIRVNELISMKDEVCHLEGEWEKVESEIIKHSLENSVLEKEMNEIEVKISGLQKNLASVAPMKEAKDKEIAVLRSKVNLMFDYIKNVKLEFERLAASHL